MVDNDRAKRLALIEANRQRALERQKRQAEAVRGRQTESAGTPGVPNAGGPVSHRDATAPTTYIKPTVRTKDYIDYDFSRLGAMENGFLVRDDVGDNTGPSSFKGRTLAEWKAAQQAQQAQDAPPPVDTELAPKCFDCGAIELDARMKQNFGVRVCKACVGKHPEKYALLTKTECREDYFLTEPELADTGLFPRIVKQNPHSGTFSRMQLFLRFQIEAYAFKKWGSAEALDKEWLRREGMKKDRKEKRWNNKLKDMRMRLRAEEITRSLKKGDTRHARHQHEWCEAVWVEGTTWKRRCTGCGMEVEEEHLGCENARTEKDGETSVVCEVGPRTLETS